MTPEQELIQESFLKVTEWVESCFNENHIKHATAAVNNFKALFPGSTFYHQLLDGSLSEVSESLNVQKRKIIEARINGSS